MGALFNNAFNTFFKSITIWHPTYVKGVLRGRKPIATNTWATLAARALLYEPSDRIAHTIAFVTPVVEHWLE